MAKLSKRKDGGYYTVVNSSGNMATLQIHPEGAELLLDNDVFPGMQILDSFRRILWQEGWFFTNRLMPSTPVPMDVENQIDDADALDLEILENVEHASTPETSIDDGTSETQAPVMIYAERPVLMCDEITKVHLRGQIETEPVVFCIKYRGAAWLRKNGTLIGREMGVGEFTTLFENRWLYPNPGWKAPGASPMKAAQTAPSEMSDAAQAIFGLVVLVLVVLGAIFLVRILF